MVAPHWGWYVILYFFLGGIAAGSYFIATMLALTGDQRDRDAVRLGYLIAFPLVIICGVLLILDLGVPLRFWHMLIQSEEVPSPMLKPWSPISVGSWVLALFGFFAFVSFTGALVETNRVSWTPLVRLDAWARERPRSIAVVWGIVGAFFGFFLAGYTGVLLTSTTIPVWHNARLLGAIFLASAASTSYALLMLMLMQHGRSHRDPTVAKLAEADTWAIVLELLLIISMVAILGSLARPFITGGFGILFWLGVVAIGLIVPLILHFVKRGSPQADRRAFIAACCVLAGGLLLRFVVVMSPQWPAVSLFAL